MPELKIELLVCGVALYVLRVWQLASCINIAFWRKEKYIFGT
jgi:hypothetical protein